MRKARACSFMCLGILCIVAAGPSSAVTRNVPADFPTIQQALDASTVGDVVLVAPGTYLGTIAFSGQHNGVSLVSSAGPDLTVIDGGRSGSTIRCVGVGPSTIIEGFTITGGGEVPLATTIGGGILIVQASPTIRGNVVRGNSAVAAGGIYVDGGSPAIVGNTISDNDAPDGSGGGIYCDHHAQPRIQGNTIVGNSCGAFGGGVTVWQGSAPEVTENTIRGNSAVAAGGIYVNGGAPAILGNTISENEAPNGSGGGIYCDHYAQPRIQGNIIVGNVCAAFGGGVTVWEGSAPEISDNTVAANRGEMGGGGIYVTRNSHPVVSRTIVAFNTTGSGVVREDSESGIALSCDDAFGNLPANYSGLADPTGANGNQSADPLFCDLAGHDFHLSAFSPCAAANSPSGCNLVGALDVTCTPTPAIRGTWGQLKAKYAPPATGK